MLDEKKLPILNFPILEISKKTTPHDLRQLLYWSGESISRRKFAEQIKKGCAGKLLIERIEVVTKIHDFIDGKLIGGGSKETIVNKIYRVTKFFDWASERNLEVTTNSIEKVYLSWADYLHHRYNVIRDLAQVGAYTDARDVGSIIDYILERKRKIILSTKLRKPSAIKNPQGRIAEKQNLTDTFTFGHLLQDICDGTPINSIDKIGLEIPLRKGGTFCIWTGGSKKRTKRELQNWEKLGEIKRKEEFENDKTLTRRGKKATINTRIEAELLMFIGQTSMNLSQAQNLKLHQYSYSSDIDGYKVIDYKNRRQGTVLFEIFKEYRPHFERYLEWRRVLFPKSDRLFPFIREGALETSVRRFDLIKKACKSSNIQWISPRQIRGTKINWLLRRSGDPDLTAELAQHSKETLLNIYDRPSSHRAYSEITRFWLANDPNLKLKSVAPGQCDGKPSATNSKPITAAAPDCIRPSGCLWCAHHRDIDTQDYVWSLASFRYLKIIEVNTFLSNQESSSHEIPAQHAVNKLTEKIKWFKESNPKRKKWVEIALSRLEKMDYHPEWLYSILAAEGAI